MLAGADRFLVDAVGEVADTIEQGPTERAPHLVEMDALFDRCRSLFGATALLLENGYGHEAIILGRALFTDSLVLAELATAEDPRRVQLMVGRSLVGLASLEGLLHGSEAWDEDVSEERGWASLARSNVERFARDSGVGTRHWKPNEKALADKHGRGPEYADFKLAHLFVHGGLGGRIRRYGLPDDHEALPDNGTADDDFWVSPAIRFACSSMLHACRAILQIQGTREPDEVGMLFALLSEIQRHRAEQG